MFRLVLVPFSILLLFLVSGCSQEEAPTKKQTQQTESKQYISSPNQNANQVVPAVKYQGAGRRPTVLPQMTDPVKMRVLERWQPKFDPSGAEFTYVLSCDGHPDIEGVAVGFNIRDEVWKRSRGRLHVDYRPLAQLGGERNVLNKLQQGVVHGVLSSSFAAANLDSRLVVVNLPFLIDSYDKLEAFRNDRDLFNLFGAPLRKRGIMVADFTGYGSYGWVSKAPVKTLEEARRANFRISNAPVNLDLYRSWKMKFTVTSRSDIPEALQAGFVDDLGHTPITYSINRKLDIDKNFTLVSYAQGLYIHLINLRWFNSLPNDLQRVLLDVIKEESAKSRAATRKQELREIEAAKSQGVNFWALSDEDRQKLIVSAQPIIAKWGQRIGVGYINNIKRKLAQIQ